MYIPKKINGAPRKKYAKIQDSPPLTPHPKPDKINNGIPANKLRIKAKSGQTGDSDFAVNLLKKEYNIPKKAIATKETIIAILMPKLYNKKIKLKKEPIINIIRMNQVNASDFSDINFSHFKML